MIPFLKKPTTPTPIVFFNTLGKKKEEFKPLSGRNIKMYTCGPTVYDYVHIGNLRSFVFADLLRRTLEYAGYEVKQVMNITDVGHLVGDGDDGEDKMTAGLKREGKALTLENMKELAERYATLFIDDLAKLNVETPFILPRASEHVAEQIAFITTLLQKGYAYQTHDGVYFDIGKFPAYGILGGDGSALHSRIGVNAEKHDSRDFSLWKNDAKLGWDAPWGKGFPGWHIECTAMSTKYLGKSFDIHTGGIDLIPIHHNNEIAQAEAVSGKPYVKYWMHGAFITIEGKRIGKSEGNAIRLYQLTERGMHPLSYRYLLLTAHYRQTMNFTWEALEAAQTARERLLRVFADLPLGGLINSAYRSRFEAAIYDDLNTAEAIAVLWELVKDEKISLGEKRATLADFDRVLGIGLGQAPEGGEEVMVSVLSEEVQALVERRVHARKENRFADADALRHELKQRGFEVDDTVAGQVLRKAGP